MNAPPRHESYARLHGAGWSVGDAAFAGPAGLIRLVTGHNGEDLIRADSATRDEAWREASWQAEAARACPPPRL